MEESKSTDALAEMDIDVDVDTDKCKWVADVKLKNVLYVVRELS